MRFKDFLGTLSESSEIEVFHGSDKKFTKIDPKYMLLDNSNAQEGVGIYFGTLKTAEQYGEYIVSTKVNSKYFVDSNGLVQDFVKPKDLVKLCKDMYKVNEEEFFYKLSDYVMVTVPKEIRNYHIEEFAEALNAEVLRYFTTDFAMTFGIENFIKSWNKHIPYIHGLHNEQLDFYSIMNTKYKLKEL